MPPPPPQQIQTALKRVQRIGFWLIVATPLGWLIFACFLGDVEHEIPPRLMRGGERYVHVILPRPPLWWPGDLRVEVFENGRRLEWEGKKPQLRPRGVGSEANDSVRAYFSASDGTNPRYNGRSYEVRYPRRLLPASMALLGFCWLFVPWFALRLSRALKQPSSSRIVSARVTAWSIVTAGSVFSLFAVQAWLVPSNAFWFFAVLAAGLPACLARLEVTVLGVGRWSVPVWLPWLLGFVAWATWAAFSGLHGSPITAAWLLLMSLWGSILYFGLRNGWGNLGERGAWLAVALFAGGIGLSLAREAGFDPVGNLASFEMSSRWRGALVNPWTTKFLWHWVLILCWCSLAAFWSQSREHRPKTAWLLFLSAGLSVGVSGSKTALVALGASALMALAAFYRGCAVRRLVIWGLVLGILLTPVWAGLPWQAHVHLSKHLPTGALNVLELDVRGGMWEFSRRLIWEHPVLGWGLGATARLPGGDLPMAQSLDLEPGAARPRALERPTLAGGHPHNAALLIWLDLGLVGALLAAGLVWAMGRSIATTEGDRRVHAALLGLVTVHAVYLLFNYPVWEPEILSILWMSAVLASVALPIRSESGLARPEPQGLSSRAFDR